MADRLVLKSSELAFGNADATPLRTFTSSTNEISLAQDDGQEFTFRVDGNLHATSNVIVDRNLSVTGEFTPDTVSTQNLQSTSVFTSTLTTTGDVTLADPDVFKIRNQVLTLGNTMVVDKNDQLVTVGNLSATGNLFVDGLNVKDRIVNAGSSTMRYYVKTTGSDSNDGRSWDRAFATIRHAASIAPSGTTIFVETGTYTEITPIRLNARVSIIGDNLRNVLLKAVDPRLDYFHVKSLCYLYGLRFIDLQRPAFCVAFPCAIAEATIQSGAVSALTVLYSPSGYTSVPPVIIEAPENLTGIQATATAILTNGVITGFTITEPGSNYGTQRPHVSIPSEAPPFVTGSPYIQNCSSITGPFNKQVPSTKISELTPLPYSTSDVDEEGAGGGCRIDGAVCYRGIVGSINITNRGSGYTSPPTVVFSDGTAAGTAVISGGEVIDVNITNGGQYVNIPTVRFVSGGGSGALGTVVMSPTPSPLRSFVADSFTQVNQGGPGHLVINLGYAQFVSCFTTFCTYSYKAVAGGFTNISTSVTDFGNYGLVSAGYWPVAISSGTVSQKYRSNVTSVTVATNTQGSGYLTTPYVLFGSAGYDETGIQASDKLAGDTFGSFVSMTSNGTRTAASAPTKTVSGSTSAGAVYIYLNGIQEAKIVAPIPSANAQFGSRVAISGDGTRVVISAYGDQRVYVYLRTGVTWTFETEISPGDKVAGDNFGSSLSVSYDATRAVIGSSAHDSAGANAGAAYVYSRSGTTWTLEQKLVASDALANAAFGTSVSLASTNGDVIIVGTPSDNPTGNPGTLNSGSVYVFTRTSTTWTQQVKKHASDAAPNDIFGSSVSLSDDGTRWAVGAPGKDSSSGSLTNTGGVYVFYGSGASWTQETNKIPAAAVSNDEVGYGVIISGDGSRVYVGSSIQNAVYTYVRVDTTWTEYDIVTASDKTSGDLFGLRGLAASSTGLKLIIGAQNKTSGTGKAYIFNAVDVATGNAVLFVDRVDSVTITNSGGLYSSVPSVTFISRGSGSGAQAVAKLTAPPLILVTNPTGRRPDIGSVMKYKSSWYTVTGATSITSGGLVTGYNVQFYPSVYAADANDVVSFYIASQVSTGAHVTEYIGSGVTYNALPEYGGVSNAGNKTLEVIPGKVYFNISDHLGNQTIGKYFAVDQLTGAVTIKTDQFSLSGLVGISFERGGRIEEVSNDPGLVSSTGTQDSMTVPTQYAVYSYVNPRTIPPAGNVGEALVKYTSNDFDASWQSVVLTNQKNVANGVPGLDSSSHISTSALPVSAVITGNVMVPVGSAATPTFTFTGYANTGTYMDTGSFCVSTSGSNRMTINPQGNVGIGVVPTTNFHVGGRMMLDNGVIQRGGTPITTTSYLGLYSNVSGDDIRFVTNGGNFGWYVDGDIGSTTKMSLSTTTGLSVSSNISSTGELTVSGNIAANQNVTAYASDQRLKSNVRVIDNALEKVQRLRGVSFDWRDDTPQPMRGHDVGLIAQDVASVLKEAVTLAPFDTDHETGLSKSGNEYLTIDIGNKLTALLIEAVKELSERVKELEENTTM